MLPRLSSLSDLTASDKGERREREREREVHAYRDGEFQSKRGDKVQTDREWELLGRVYKMKM